MKKLVKKIAASGLAFVLAAGMLTGCGDKATIENNGQPKAFTYDGTDVYMNEAWLYATMQQISYEQQYASMYTPAELWSQQVDETTDEEGNTKVVTLEDMVKDETIERIKMTKVMCNRGAEMGIQLTEEDTSDIDTYVDSAMENLASADLEGHGVTRDTVRAVYEQEIMAQKVYDEVSNGDIVLTYNLLFETFKQLETGEREAFSEAKKAKQKAKAEKALAKLQSGADVVKLAKKMKADKSSYVAISEATRANYAAEYVAASDELAKVGDNGAISPITESDFGYHILVYVTADDEKYESDEAKNAISSEQQNLFASKYEEWVADLEADWNKEEDVNMEEWNKVKFTDGSATKSTEAEPDTEE